MEHRFPASWGGVPIMMALGPTFVALFPAGETERQRGDIEGVQRRRIAQSFPISGAPNAIRDALKEAAE